MGKKHTDYGYLAHIGKVVLVFLGILVAVFMVYGLTKPLPEGVNYKSAEYNVPSDDVSFLYDVTYIDSEGNRVSEQHIFNAVFDMIENAEQYILIDMFLFNEFQGKIPENTRALSSELTQALIDKKQSNSDIQIAFITDPINNVYGGDPSEQLQSLKDSGITVIETDLNQLRESNFMYSAFYNIFLQWMGNSEGGFVSHPFSPGEKVSIRTYLTMMNFKANHRKLILTDDGNGEFISLITSANPHDGSSAHTNVAIQVRNSIFKDIYITESAVASFSESGIFKLQYEAFSEETGDVSVQLLTEQRIKDALLKELERTKSGDKVDIMMFYLSDRDIVRKLIRIANRGVTVRLLLDPNKDAFGRKKNGIPNRQVANELHKNSKGRIQIKWYDTHGEQNHAKMILIKKEGETILIIGSANLTRRNIDNYNLETNIIIVGNEDDAVMNDAAAFFERTFSNDDGNSYSVGFNAYQEKGTIKFIMYYLMELLGTSTF